MANYSEQQREFNRESRYLHRVWTKIDEKVELPPSLNGDALLPLLDGGMERAPKSNVRKVRFSPMTFSWKSGVTYAAAFVFIVALSALLGRGKPAEGGIMPDDPPPVGAEAEETSQVGGVDRADYDPGEVQPDPVTPRTYGEPTDNQPADTPQTASGAITSGETDEPDGGPDAVGGQSLSVHLATDDLYTYTYRVNDPTDPAKAGYPVTVNVVHTNTDALVFQLDISDLESIESCLLYERTAAFVGISASGGVTMHVFDLSLVGSPKDLGSVSQQGSLLEAKIHRNVVNLFTYADSGVNPGCEVIDLPGSQESGMVIVSAVDVGNMDAERLAISGAGKDVSLYNFNAYLQYRGEPTEENEEGVYTAHIRLDGTSIDFRGNQDPEEE